MRGSAAPQWTLSRVRDDVKLDRRADQFVRLRDVIEARAEQRYFENPPQTDRPVIWRSNDF